MTASVVVHGKSLSVDEQRFEKSQQILAQPGKDLADLTDDEFERGIRRIKTVQARMQKLLDEVLQENVHYGKEKDSRGNPVFKKPILKKAGAEEIRRLMRWTLRDMTTPEITRDEDGHQRVMVHLGVFDSLGHLMSSAQGVCHTAEPRFLRFDKKGFIYQDAREQLHNLTSMARKRAGVAATCEASGATAFFANREEMVDVVDADDDEDTVITPWSDDERKEVFDLAISRGMGRKALESLTVDLFGRLKVSTGMEAKKLLAAVKDWVQRNPQPVGNTTPEAKDQTSAPNGTEDAELDRLAALDSGDLDGDA